MEIVSEAQLAGHPTAQPRIPYLPSPPLTLPPFLYQNVWR